MAIIEVNNLVKQYGSGAGVNGLSFTVEQGEIFGLLGPNGAGKTTAVECLEGLRPPDSGEVRVCGLDPGTQEVQLRERLGAQLQESELPDKLTVGEAMRLYSSFYRTPDDWRELLEALKLTDKIDTQFRWLSGGQKQRLAIALALLGNPQVAIMDELTTGLDPQARRDTWSLVESIRDRGVTVVLVTHFMDEAERLCDRLAVVDSGRLVALDTPAGLASRVDDRQRIRFQSSPPLNTAVFNGLPEVASVTRVGSQVEVTGTGNLLLQVATTLAHEGVVPVNLRVEQASLEDAFVALTGRPAYSEEEI